MAGERAGLGRHALHEIAVGGEHPDPVVDERQRLPVESRRQHLARHRHADRVGNPLTQRSGGRLDAGRESMLRMSRRLRLQLPEPLELAHRQVVAREVEQRIEERRGVAAREHEAVAVRPVGAVRVVAKELAPHHVGHRRLSERRAGMSGFRLLDHVDGEKANRVDAQRVEVVRGHRDLREGSRV
jgi:hypothetical protein